GLRPCGLGTQSAAHHDAPDEAEPSWSSRVPLASATENAAKQAVATRQPGQVTAETMNAAKATTTASGAHQRTMPARHSASAEIGSASASPAKPGSWKIGMPHETSATRSCIALTPSTPQSWAVAESTQSAKSSPGSVVIPAQPRTPPTLANHTPRPRTSPATSSAVPIQNE